MLQADLFGHATGHLGLARRSIRTYKHANLFGHAPLRSCTPPVLPPKPVNNFCLLAPSDAACQSIWTGDRSSRSSDVPTLKEWLPKTANSTPFYKVFWSGRLPLSQFSVTMLLASAIFLLSTVTLPTSISKGVGGRLASTTRPTNDQVVPKVFQNLDGRLPH